MDGQRRAPFASVSPAQAVKLLSSQIPEFSGSEDDNVELWIQKIERVSQIHGVSHEVTFLAATGKLTKSARRWYDLSNGSTIESWFGFREAIIKCYRKRILFHVAMQKVEARKWIYNKESFQDYAMDKLALMKNLRLPEQESMHLLINGIGSKALRSTATALRVDSVDQFLEEMHPITIPYGEQYKKVPSPSRNSEKGKPFEKSSNKAGQHQAKITKDIFCVYCRTKGHVRDDCYKLKRKEQQQTTSHSPAATVSAVDDKASEETTVALVNEDKAIKTGKIILTLSKINGVACKLSALIDTGSPISLVSNTVLEKYLKSSSSVLESQLKSFSAVNGTAIYVYHWFY